MRTKVHMWGNSLGIRIPKAYAVHLGMSSGEEVELSLASDGLRLVPAENLKQLLESITLKNLHTETDTWASQGKELW